jgi:hypothetical protein
MRPNEPEPRWACHVCLRGRKPIGCLLADFFAGVRERRVWE